MARCRPVLLYNRRVSDEPSTDELWDDYLATRSLDDRNALVVRYGSLVRAVASKVASGLPSSVDRDDLVAYGQFGLIDAIERYDRDRNVKFETFAITRIRGSILDEIRALDWVPRSVRTKARGLDKAAVLLEAQLGRPPTPEEVAEHLEISVSDIASSNSMVVAGYVGSIDDTFPGVSADAQQVIMIDGNPEDAVMVAEVTEILAGAVSKMPELMRAVVVLYYVEELTLAEIGEMFGVTESRICQLQGRLLRSLRESLGQGRVSLN